MMLPDETFFMRPDSAETDLDDWFAQLVDKARQARATLLGRPVFKEEYFEVLFPRLVSYCCFLSSILYFLFMNFVVY